MAKDLKVKKWINSGEIGDDAKDQDDILEAAGGLLDGAEAHEILGGGILFEATNGKHYVVTVEAVIAEAHPEFVKDFLGDMEGE